MEGGPGVKGMEQGWLGLEGDCPDYPPLDDYEPMVRARNEIEILGMSIRDHPMQILREEARERGCISTADAARRIGERVRVAGIVAATRKVRTQKGGLMQFLTIEDESGLIESTLFPRVCEAFSTRIRSLGPYVVEGTIEVDHRAINLNVSRVEAWSSPGEELPEPAAEAEHDGVGEETA